MLREELLEVLEKNGRVSVDDLSVMLSVSKEEIIHEMDQMEKEHVIAGYHTLINWDKTNQERVTAMIEVKVVPQRDEGFDAIASRIYGFDEVSSVFLMSGPFDLMVIVEGKTMQQVSLFVRERLAVLDNVTSTATYFILKRYKDYGILMDSPKKDERMTIWL